MSTDSPGHQQLLGEAEALHLVELGAGLARASRCRSRCRRSAAARRWSRDSGRSCSSPRRTLTSRSSGSKRHGRLGVDVGVEAHRATRAGEHRPVARLRRAASCRRSRWPAEQAVERHRGEGEADHADDDGASSRRRARCVARRGVAALIASSSPIRTMVMTKNSRQHRRAGSRPRQVLAPAGGGADRCRRAAACHGHRSSDDDPLERAGRASSGREQQERDRAARSGTSAAPRRGRVVVGGRATPRRHGR